MTPLHHYKLPLWTFGYVFLEALQYFPQFISAAAIKRRLGVSKNASFTIKRRLQLVLNDLLPSVKALMAEDMEQAFGPDFRLPEDPDADLTELLKDKPYVVTDTVALFSCRERSNGFKRRKRHRGQTSSIYRSDDVALETGKSQVGTLVSTIAVKGGAAVFNSVPNQKQKTIQPLFDFLPENFVCMSDEGLPWLSRINASHRAVNHSARAVDSGRNVWSRQRWCKNGLVSSATAEGNQRWLKHAMLSAYSYTSPKYSHLYMAEASVLKSLRAFGFERVLDMRSRLLEGSSASCGSMVGDGVDVDSRPGICCWR